MLYSNYSVSNSPNFNGKFLSKGLVDDAVKASQKYYMKGCQKNGVKIEQSQLDGFVESGEKIKNNLQDIASQLPEELDLALTKDKDWNGRKGLCLDFVHKKLGKIEVFGNPDHHRQANMRRFYGDKISLNTVGIAIEGINEIPPQKLINRFIAMQEGRITHDIKQNSCSLKQSRANIDTLTEFTENHTEDRAKYLKGRLDYEYNKEAQKVENKKANRTFLFKRFFGINN